MTTPDTIAPTGQYTTEACGILGVRIWELRNEQGMNIRTEQFRTESGKIVAAYSLNI